MDSANKLEIEAFRLPLAAAVAAKLDVFGFGPQSEHELRESIRSKDSRTLSLMDDYLAKLLERARASEEGAGERFQKAAEACEVARKDLVARTVEVSPSN